ncbi:hypothetical protein ACJX0J_008583, partial [Zea mays]
MHFIQIRCMHFIQIRCMHFFQIRSIHKVAVKCVGQNESRHHSFQETVCMPKVAVKCVGQNESRHHSSIHGHQINITQRGMTQIPSVGRVFNLFLYMNQYLNAQEGNPIHAICYCVVIFEQSQKEKIEIPNNGDIDSEELQ